MCRDGNVKTIRLTDFGTCSFSQEEKKRSILVPAEEFMQLITASVATISGAVEVINVTDLNISVTFH